MEEDTVYMVESHSITTQEKQLSDSSGELTLGAAY